MAVEVAASVRHVAGMRLVQYALQATVWPAVGKHILASYDDSSIVVYQAYNDRIADAVVAANNFHSEEVLRAGYIRTRMSWIKTNFLWMMFRSGWATKADQTRVLALRLTRVGFEELLASAATKGPGDVRLQWDPDHDPAGDKAGDRRAIQLGLRGRALERLSTEFLVSVSDVTDFVREQAAVAATSELMTPLERVYICQNEAAAKNVSLDKVLRTPFVGSRQN